MSKAKNRSPSVKSGVPLNTLTAGLTLLNSLCLAHPLAEPGLLRRFFLAISRCPYRRWILAYIPVCFSHL